MLCSIVPAILLGAASASADGVGLEPAHSHTAAQSSTLYWIALVVIVVLVAAINIALLYAIRRSRSSRVAIARQAPETAERAQASSGVSMVILGLLVLLVGIALISALPAAALIVIAVLIALGCIAFARSIGNRRGEPVASPLALLRESGVQLPVGTALAALAISLFVISIVFTDRAREASADGDSIQITATGQQWLWRYDYPAPNAGVAHPFSYYRLVVPVDTTVNLHIVSTDVAHSWYVPELAGKADAIPGKVHVLSFRADEEGLYNGESAVFSGQGFAAMRTVVQVVSADQYKTYVSDLSTELQDSQDAVVKEIKARSEMP